MTNDDDVKAYTKIENILYATVDTTELKLDLYLPTSKRVPTLLVWIHGGAWMKGNRKGIPKYILDCLNHGYAIASLDYRLSGQAQFPAQVHDIKAGIRFLRAHADDYAYNASRIGIMGISAGGHLAALVGVSNGNSTLEGLVGKNLNISSNVQAIVSLFGASNLTTILQQSTPHGLSVRVPALEGLLGGQPDEVPALARLASPVFHVDPADPPLMLLHGDQDPQMPINQSHELFGAYQKLKLTAQFEVVYGAGHGGTAFKETSDRIIEFLNESLR